MDAQHTQTRIALAAAGFLALHLLFAYWQPLPMWGVHLLAFYPAWMRALVLVLCVLLLIPTAGQNLIGRLSALSFTPWASPRSLALTGLLLAAIGAAAFVALRSAVHLLGDGYLLLRDLPMFQPETSWKGVNAPFAYWLVKTAYRSGLFPSPEFAYRTFSVLSGIAYLLLALVAARALGRSDLERTVLLGFLLSAGYLQLFFGYVETYPLLFPAILLYLLSAAGTLQGRLPLAVPALTLGLLVPLHFTLVALAPSFLFLLYHRFRTQRNGQPSGTPSWPALRSSLACLLLAPLLSLTLLILIGFGPVAYLQTARGSHLLPLIAQPGFLHAYRIFSPAHLLDLLNLYLLTAPAALLVLPLLKRGSPTATPLHTFLLLAASFPLLFTLLANPEVGAFRDWDAFAFPALPFTLWAGVVLVHRIKEGAALKQAGLLLCGAAALHTLLWIGLNARPAAAEARYAALLERGYLSPNARSYGYETLGGYFRDRNRHLDAVHAYEKAIEASPPGNPRHWISLGNRYMDLGRHGSALEALRRAFELAPEFANTYAVNMANAHAGMGNVLFRSNDYEKAIEHYRKALEIDPDLADIVYNLGVVYEKLGRYEQAIQQYQKAIAQQPAMVKAYVNMGNAFSSLQQYEKAIEHYQKALEISPTHINAIFNTGIAYRDLGQIEKARLTFQKVLELDPNYPQAPGIRAWLEAHP